MTVCRLTGQDVPPDLAGVPSAPYSLTKGVVFLIVENGMGPSRRAVTIHMFLPPPVGYTGFAFPVLDFTAAPLSRVDWSDNLGDSGHTLRVADMDAVVSYEFKESMRVLLVRQIAGTLVKEGATIAGYAIARNNSQNHGGGYGNFESTLVAWAIIAGASLYKYTFNTTDTRSWQTLPKEFQATNFPMPKDGIVRLGFNGGPIIKVLQLDSSKKMTVIYVQSPGNGVFSTKVFQFD